MLRLVEFLKKIRSKDLKFYATISVLFLIIVFTQKNIWFGDQSRVDLRNLEKEILTLTEEKIRLENQNKLLEEEKIKLSSGREAIEGLARSELGLIKPGEKFYIFEAAVKEDTLTVAEVN
jgi:cell division protein FtsB